MTHSSFDKASLMNNLLGAVGNAAGAKKMAVKNHADSADRFQEVMQRARPEIAARDAVATQRREIAKRVDEPKPKVIDTRTAAQSQERAKAAAESQEQARIKSVRSERANTKTTEHVDSHHHPTKESVAETSPDDQVTAAETANASTDKSDKQDNDKTVAAESLTDEIAEHSSSNFAAVVPVVEELIDGEKLEGGLSPLVFTALSLTTETDLSLLAPDAIPESLNSFVAEVAATLAQSASALNDTKTAGGTASAGTKGSTAMGFDLAAMLSGEAELGDTSLQAADGDAILNMESGDASDSLIGTKTAFSKLMDAAFLNAAASGEKAAQTLDAAKLAPTTGSPALEALTRLSEAQSSPSARAFVVQTAVSVPVGQPQWSQAVGDKVLWLAAQNVSAAEIRLDPPDLGPMSVKVSVNQDQATVSFTSPHPIVREVLDQQLNRLREMFAEQGLNLVNVDVSDKSFAQQEREKNESGSGADATVDDEDELQAVAVSSAINMRLVDHYA